MKRITLHTAILGLVALIAIACQNANSQVIPETALFNGKGDGVTMNTEALNAAIANLREGDSLVIPKGNYLTGTIKLKSNVTLVLQEGATLIASENPEDYDHYRPTKDMSKYDTGEGTRNANLASDADWVKALLLAQNVENVTIKGSGTIDGRHVQNPNGEESMRGPHTIIIAESKNVNVEGVRIRCAANYAILGYELQDCSFSTLDIEEGWDGIHVRGCNNVTIQNCDLKTGDDAIAGGYWENMTIQNCRINSSCNGIRMIAPSTNLTISDCHIYGPGKFPHRTSGDEKRTSTIYGIVLEPGAWGDSPGHTEGVTIRNITVDNLRTPLVYSMGDNNTCSGLLVDGLTATNINSYTVPLKNEMNCPHMWDNIEMRNIKISKGN